MLGVPTTLHSRVFFGRKAGMAVSYCLGRYRVQKKPVCEVWSPHFEPKKQGRQIFDNFIRVPPYRLGSKLATLVFRLKMCGQGALPQFPCAFANLSPFRRAFATFAAFNAKHVQDVANARQMHN